LQYGSETVVKFVVVQEDILENLVYVGFALGD